MLGCMSLSTVVPPDISGQNKANPLAMILSAAWMLRLSFDMDTEASSIESAVKLALTENQTTADLGGPLSTQQVGSWIAKYVQN
jgi:3-isopropylmalate dehydrogenase